MNSHFPASRTCTATLAGLLLLGPVLAISPNLEAKDPQDKDKAAELFQMTKVWTVHLTFTPEQWEAMEPKGGSGFFGGPGGGGRGSPGGMRGGGGPGAFGPGMFLAPAFLSQADENKDSKLSLQEFETLAEKWFAAWDKTKSGKINSDQLRAGLNSTMGGMPGPGGPGGGGGRGPGLNLQGSEGRRNGLASAMGVEFNYVHADFEFDGKIFKDAAVRYKGNGTWMQSRGSDKRSMKVDLNEYVKGQKLNGISKLNFHNCVTDSSWMNEVLSHALFRDAGVPAPRTAYARVSITVPGKLERKYVGLYSMVENLDDNFADRHFGTKKGAIFKPVTPAPFTDMGDDWKNYNQTYDPKTDLKPEQKQRVIDFCKLVSHADDATFAAKVGDFVELDQFARFMAVTVWLSTLDSILSVGQNYYVYLHPQTQKFQFMPWDLDHSFGQFFLMGNQEQRDNLSIHRPWRGENRFLDRVFKVDAFKQLYLARLAEFSETIFQPGRFEKQVDAIAAAIRDAVKDESEEKLARFDKVAAGEAVPPAGFGGGFGGPRPGGGDAGAPSRGPAPGFFSPAKPIKAFVKVRAQSVRDQLAGKSKGESIPEFGFGQRGPGGRGGDFGPGNFLGGPLMTSLDGNKDSELTRAEVVDGFKRWFHSWNTDKSGTLTEEQLRAGITQELTPFRGGPGGGNPAGGPPPR